MGSCIKSVNDKTNSSNHDGVIQRRILISFPHSTRSNKTSCSVYHGSEVVEEGKGDTHEWGATRSADLDFGPHGLGFLLGFDEDVATCRASLGFP